MIQLKNLNKVYDAGEDPIHALRQVNLTIEKGENVVVIGQSGSGKSTFLNIIAGIDRPTLGEVIVAGTDLNRLSERALARWRGWHIGIVFQFYQLLPTLSAKDNVLFAMSLVDKVPKKERSQKAERYLGSVGLAHKLKKFPNQLSGGERQRVAIARAMANDPLLIIADEPTGNLDSKTGEQIYQVFYQLNEQGTTLITVTHADIEGQSFDRLIRIKDGQLTDQFFSE